MNLLLSTKGSDVTAWRGVEDFAASYRQALLNRAASDLCGNSESAFSEAAAALETSIATHQTLLQQLNSLIEKMHTTPLSRLNGLSVTFYSDLYSHFGLFRSASAFYQLSMTFLKSLSATIVTQTAEQLDMSVHHLPEFSLIALGPAGRCEYSPFQPLQMLLVHGKATGAPLQSINIFCHALHAGFEEAGLSVDPIVTPQNPGWRGNVSEWRQRCVEKLHPRSDEDDIELYRLVDQFPLFSTDSFSRELKQISNSLLGANRSGVADLVKRMGELSNGIGIMGGLKLERSGSERGLFRLLDHGLLPFSAALTALALIKGSMAESSCERIHDLLKRGVLDVELAETMLSTWHNLHALRLWQEQSFRLDEHTSHTAFLNPDDLTPEQRQSLKKSLESVAGIQRHVEIIFSGIGE